MIKKLLFTLLTFTALNTYGQTETVTIDWSFGSNSDVMPATAANNTDRTIEVGDTVVWNYYATGTHTVTSEAGSAESWDSGLIASGSGVTYSKTFTTVGANAYVCTPHNGNMYGTITVVADGTLSSPQFDAPTKFSIFPNPSTNVMNINIPMLTDEGLKLEVFNVLGKKVYVQQLSKLSSSVNIAKWNSGLYLVRLTSPDQEITLTKRFVKL
ncbi:T9SS type A sorting domain-containing protein [Lacinutrix algicola]|uniref:T9SS type A sorting domain-containing protein n=1 Tax=Lacinutrix algicola TaxID=342954 RepID=UPI0006E3FDC8|nr:T9SS type A sorting domain-containing protein [Lacinutrix algicola]